MGCDVVSAALYGNDMSRPHCCELVAIAHRNLGSTEHAVTLDVTAMGQAASYLKAGFFSTFPRLPALTFHAPCGLNSRVNWAAVLLWEPT